MKRRLLNLVTALSLLLCAPTVMLWVRSYRSHGRVGWSTAVARYTLHSDRGRLRLAGPPPPGPPDGGARARQVVARLRNEHARWEVYRQDQNGRSVIVSVQAQPIKDTAASEVHQRQAASFRRPLLRALDEPEKFVAAHNLLRYVQQGSYRAPFHERPDGSIAYSRDGLAVELLPKGAEQSGEWGVTTQFTYAKPGSWRFDSAQLGPVRDLWHDRLDVTLAAVPHGLLAPPRCCRPSSGSPPAGARPPAGDTASAPPAATTSAPRPAAARSAARWGTTASRQPPPRSHVHDDGGLPGLFGVRVPDLLRGRRHTHVR